MPLFISPDKNVAHLYIADFNKFFAEKHRLTAMWRDQPELLHVTNENYHKKQKKGAILNAIARALEWHADAAKSAIHSLRTQYKSPTEPRRRTIPRDLRRKIGSIGGWFLNWISYPGVLLGVQERVILAMTTWVKKMLSTNRGKINVMESVDESMAVWNSPFDVISESQSDSGSNSATFRKSAAIARPTCSTSKEIHKLRGLLPCVGRLMEHAENAFLLAGKIGSRFSLPLDSAAILDEYVANEIRALHSETQQRLLKGRIMECIIATYDELDMQSQLYTAGTVESREGSALHAQFSYAT